MLLSPSTEEPMRTAYLLLDIDGVFIPFPTKDGGTPPTHVRHDVVPTGRNPDDPVTIWLDPAHGPLLMEVARCGLVTPVWCTSWRQDAATMIGPLLGIPAFRTSTCRAPGSPPATPMATCGNGTMWRSGRRRLPSRGSTTTSLTSIMSGPHGGPRPDCRPS